MINQLYINDKDAWTTWGVFLEDGSDAKLLLPPPNKEYVENKCSSQPGKQIFAKHSFPDERDLQLVFCISAVDRKDFLLKYRNFVNELNSGIINFKVISIETRFMFTTSSYSELSYFERLGKLVVRFNEPNPKDEKSTLLTAYLLATKGKVLVSKSNKVLTENIQ